MPGARQAAIRLGGSRNVLLVAAAAAALGAYHERQGRPVSELRLASPILVRATRSGGGNSFAPLRVEVPATVGHPTTHFGVVADRLARARREPAMHLTGAPDDGHQPAAQPGAAPGRAGADRHRRLHRHRPVGAADVRVDLRRDDPRQLPVRAPRRPPRQHHGARQRWRLDLGIALDPGAIKAPDVFLECLEAAFARLIDGTDRPASGAWPRWRAPRSRRPLRRRPAAG